MILKNERNMLFSIIQSRSLDPKEFIIEVEDVTTGAHGGGFAGLGEFLGVIRLFLRDEPRFKFGATKYERGWRFSGIEFPEFVNAIALRREPVLRESQGQFEDLLRFFEGWLSESVRLYFGERSAPDLWKQIQASREATDLAIPGADLDERFSEPEKDQLRIAIQTFKILVVNQFQPSPEQLRRIEARLDHIVEVLEKDPPKVDWKGIAISALIGIATDLALDPEKTRRLFLLFQEAVTKALHLLS
jgi:hypothetical protein